ncbi:sporulation protein YqfD [Clostridium carnis]
MGTEVFKPGIIVVEINILSPERVLNILWNENVKILNVKRVDIATIRVKIYYDDYYKTREIVKSQRGKMKIVGSGGFLFFLGRLKRRGALVIGGMLFLAIIFYLSTYVWRIEIETKKNVSPYEVRQQLYKIGVKPGMKKKDIDGKTIEKKIEDINSDILWLRARVEGSTLKIFIEEKVNPPKEVTKKFGNLASKMEGEISRIYAFSGRAKVKVGDIVKPGDIVIEGINGKEEEPYEEEPSGVVMANTFYEKSMKVKIQGTELQRSGRKDSDIYISLFDKKIYLKKAIKDFKEYDRIEESGKVFNKVLYFERTEIPVKLTEEEGVKNAVKELTESLRNDLTREAKVLDKIIKTKTDTDGDIIVNVGFVVEQNIVNNEPVDY